MGSGIKLFAAINIGSYEIDLKIFEVSLKGGIKEINRVRQRIELGRDTFRSGRIEATSMNRLCAGLIRFMEIIKEYQIQDYRICATTAIREAYNMLVIVEQIRARTGFEVEVLSNSKQRYLGYKSIASGEAEFQSMIRKGTTIIDIGGGSIQISLFDNDALITTQNILLGTLRIREKLADIDYSREDFVELVRELVDYELEDFKALYMDSLEIKNVIIVGDYTPILRKEVSGEDTVFEAARDKFISCCVKLQKMMPQEAADKLGLALEDAMLLLPAAIIYESFLKQTEAESVWMPGLDLNDGLVYEYAEKNKLIKNYHNFEDDIIATARHIALRYINEETHIKMVEEACMVIFDSLKKLYGFTKRERLLLKIAAILHDCGKYINLSKTAESSSNIILATEIIGMSHRERELVAAIVRSNTEVGLEDIEEPIQADAREDYLLTVKLASILRISNALDRSHRQKYSEIKACVKEDTLLITVDAIEDMMLEKGLFAAKAEFFEEVYGIRPLLIQKKKIQTEY